MQKVLQLLQFLGVSPDQVDLAEVAQFLDVDASQRSFDDVLRLLRAPFPNNAIEYHDPSSKKKPYISHEWYRKRLIEVAPGRVEFTIHDTDFKTLSKGGVEHFVATANCSLQIEEWKFSALGTNVVKFLTNDPNTPADLGGSLKSAVTNAFVGCCKNFFMSIEQMLAVKGEKVPGDTITGASGGQVSYSNAADQPVGDVCVKCGSPRWQSDVQACQEVNAGRVPYCKRCIPEHMVRKVKGR